MRQENAELQPIKYPKASKPTSALRAWAQMLVFATALFVCLAIYDYRLGQIQTDFQECEARQDKIDDYYGIHTGMGG